MCQVYTRTWHVKGPFGPIRKIVGVAKPPEDCGGAPGYSNLKEIIADPGDEEYEDMVEWCGDDFIPDVVDINQIQQRLNAIK